MTLFKGIFLTFFVSFLLFKAHAQYNDAVLLGDVKALTLYKGHYTTHRRNPPVLQLQCVGGTAGCSHTPDVVQCVNMGPDGIDYQWECKADLDKTVKFGRVMVTCEGYNSPNDPYVLRGSCGLEYALDFTGSQHQTSHHNQYSYSNHKGHKDWESGYSSMAGVVIFVIIVAAIYWFSTWNAARPTGPPPPPPYGFDPPPPPSSGFGPPPPSYGFKTSGYSGQRDNPNQGGLGGFWTGAGVGGLMGYLFGSRNNNGTHTTYSRPSSYSHHQSFGSGASTSSGSGSPSTGSRTASGYGGTKRR